jgi:hypothetical protein
MLYLMISMIDPCNSNADLSKKKITATSVFQYVFSSVCYSESNKEYRTGSLFLIRRWHFYLNIVMQMLWEMIIMIYPFNSNAYLSNITETGVFLYVFSAISYSESNELEQFISASNKENGTGSLFLFRLWHFF